MYRIVIGVIGGSVLLTSPALGGERVSFDARYSAWHATDIAVVSEEGTVVETWKGDAQPGDTFPLQEWMIPVDPKVDPGFAPPRAGEPERVSGKRRVVYLIQDEESGWKPATWGDEPIACVAWLEPNAVYGYQQLINPGNQVLIRLDWDEKEMRVEVTEAVDLQTRLRKAREADSATGRALGALPLVDSTNYWCRQEAFEILADSGAAAIPVLQPLLNDADRLRMHPDLIRAIRQASGEEAIPVLVSVLEEEVRYWRDAGPTLAQDWWGQEPMTLHYGRLYHVLWELDQAGYRDERNLVREFRDFWQETPQLDAIGKGIGADGQAVGESQIVEAANMILVN